MRYGDDQCTHRREVLHVRVFDVSVEKFQLPLNHINIFLLYLFHLCPQFCTAIHLLPKDETSGPVSCALFLYYIAFLVYFDRTSSSTVSFLEAA